MRYSDGSSVRAGDLIWWAEGHCVGFVQVVIETEADLLEWGLAQPHLSIGGHPYRPGKHGFVTCTASKLADEGIARLIYDDRLSLSRGIKQALDQAKVDPSTTDLFVQTEAGDSVQTAWLITVRVPGEESATIRGSSGNLVADRLGDGGFVLWGS
jgi:hypothetical protein